MYHQAGVSGPSEFGTLPETDRLFWEGWLEGQINRKREMYENS